MTIETIEHNGNIYPAFQASGFAARFAFSFALEVCKGFGFDVGCGKEEWALPGSVPIDGRILTPEFTSPTGHTIPAGGWVADSLPVYNVDYIFSSHCLEHVINWVEVLDYWTRDVIKPGGVLFLYLPHYSQTYWRPWHNRKHVNIFTPEIINNYMKDRGFANIFVSGVDANNSFTAFANTPK